MKTLLSFNNDTQLKTDLIEEVKYHQEMDMIIQGSYSKQNGVWKGCKVGCSIHSLNKIRGTEFKYDDHSAYEQGFGVPRIIARLTDRIFEGLSVEDSHKFPLRFWSAVPVGKDLTPVWKKFLVWLLVDPVEGVIKHAKSNEGRKVIQNVADLIERSLIENIISEQFQAVRLAARKYVVDADYAAAYADAADVDYAAYAAYAAAYAAAYVDYAAAYAYAADVAKRRKYAVMADKLIELLQSA